MYACIYAHIHTYINRSNCFVTYTLIRALSPLLLPTSPNLCQMISHGIFRRVSGRNPARRFGSPPLFCLLCLACPLEQSGAALVINTPALDRFVSA